MKHLALRARSANSRAPYTATGLGDRLHSVILAWAYGHEYNEPVTLHLTADKMTGGQFGNKPESWAEIVRLFPKGRVHIQSHDVIPESEAHWLSYLAKRGIDAVSYRYGDYPGKYETAGEDISAYLKRFPRLSAEGTLGLKMPYVTVQWDANSAARRLTREQQQKVEQRYRDLGYELVAVGGESKDERLRWSLASIAYAMSRAVFHVGVDSAFLHLAQLYMQWERIHLYGNVQGHHVRRARDAGSPFNLYL